MALPILRGKQDLMAHHAGTRRIRAILAGTPSPGRGRIGFAANLRQSPADGGRGRGGLAALGQARGFFLSFLMIGALASASLPNLARAAEPPRTDAAMEDRIKGLIPEIEAYATSGMKGFDVPGLAIGIVAGDKIIYAKGFGVRGKAGGAPADTRTVFQIGSTTKAFLTTTMAIMVDRGKLRWDDRVVDLDPEFQLKDPWVTREFRVFDLAAQRSGLPPTPTTSSPISASTRRR